jgi:hypothetical protein
MIKPYIECKGPDVCYTSSGTTSGDFGYHAFFVTYVPFIPSFLSDDFTRMISGEMTRIKLIAYRQIRFLNDLCSCKSNAFETFELRFVSIPQAGQPYSKVYIFFIGKVFNVDLHEAETMAVNLWKKLHSFFPLEDPFNYPLQTISSIDDDEGKSKPSEPDLFSLALKPIAFSGKSNKNIIEIRKYEDRDPMLNNGGSEDVETDQFIGYFPHPFRPTLDFSAMSRFLETFAKQSQICVASIGLRPTSLSVEEQKHIDRVMQYYKKLVSNSEQADNWLFLYRGERYADIVATFNPIINERKHLFEIKIQILGSEYIPYDVVAALGSEIMNNTTDEPRLWSEVSPHNEEELAIAIKNFDMLEYRPWKRLSSELPLWRLSTLVTAWEAVGAFRLPVPPESGHMPGINVRDEPFVMPAELATPQKSIVKNDIYIPLGKIIHRGAVTETDFLLSLSQLKRHGLVTGSTGSGKTNTCLHLLTELWKNGQIPFLVIYPIDKPDYRLLMADNNVRDQLFIFTVGDDTTSPFRFNPFAVPNGVLVRTHISLLMRAFSAAFSMWDPLPAVYRAALRRTYEEAGYHDLRIAKGGDGGTSIPLFSRFYEVLVDVAEQMTQEYGREAKGNIRQGSEIRIRDLLQNAGNVLNVDQGVPWEMILDHPTVMEIGRVGSSEDSSLIMGFLLMGLTSFLASHHKSKRACNQHITLIEEAHRLMSAKGDGGSEFTGNPRAQASEDFSNILAEVRGYNESILIAEQIPTELVTGAIGNTYVKIMHWLEEQSSFRLFSDVMNLNKQQRDFARTIPTGQAIVRGVNSRPILVKVNNYLDQFQHPDDTPVIDDSDIAINTFMKDQLNKFQFNNPVPIDFYPNKIKKVDEVPSLHQTPVKIKIENSDSSWMLKIPMQTCANCLPLLTTKKCIVGKNRLSKYVKQDTTFDNQCGHLFQEYIQQQDEIKSTSIYQEIIALFDDHFSKPEAKFSAYKKYCVMYCYLAHRVNNVLFESRKSHHNDYKFTRKRAIKLLGLAKQTVQSNNDILSG